MTYAKNRVPEGFSIDGEWENDTIIIRHNRIGMRAMNVFLILFFAVWTFASIKVIGVYWDEKIHGGQVGALEGLPFYPMRIGLKTDLMLGFPHWAHQ